MNPEVQNYINQSGAAGVSDTQIRQNLLGAGWTEAAIAEVMGGTVSIPPALHKQKSKGIWFSAIFLAILNLITFGVLYFVVMLRVYYIALPTWFDIVVFVFPAFFVVGAVWILSLLVRRRVPNGASSLPFEIYCLLFSVILLNLFFVSYSASAGHGSPVLAFVHLAGVVLVLLIYGSVFKFVSKKRTIIFVLILVALSAWSAVGPKILNNLDSASKNREMEESVSEVGVPPLVLATAEEKAKADELGMVYVPEGNFIAGTPKGQKYPESYPLQTIYLSSFYIDKYEVTNKQFQDFISANPQWQAKNVKYPLQDGEYLLSFRNNDKVSEDKYQYPVINVTWNSADAFCKINGKRLPTFAEWEKAARGTDGRIYSWGNDRIYDQANLCDKNCNLRDRNTSWNDGFAYTAPVGSFPKDVSPYGTYDMMGNVSEFVQDWDGPSSYKEGSYNYFKNMPASNPQGPPAEGSIQKMYRGNDYYNAGNFPVVIYTYHGISPSGTRNDLGFRCAADVK